MKTYFKAIMNSIIHIFNLHVNFGVILLKWVISIRWAQQQYEMMIWYGCRSTSFVKAVLPNQIRVASEPEPRRLRGRTCFIVHVQ